MTLFEPVRPQMFVPRKKVSMRLASERPLKKAAAFAMLLSTIHFLMET